MGRLPLRREAAGNGDKLERCIDAVVEGLKAKLPTYGRDLAVDASDLPAYAAGHRFTPTGKPRERYSDPDAAWGHRSAVSVRKGGGFYGFKLHLAACTRTGLPVAWHVESANEAESLFSAPLIDVARGRGLHVDTVAMDRGYDIGRVHEECAERDCLPVVPLKQMIWTGRTYGRSGMRVNRFANGFANPS